ncbi:MAG: peptidylprolyl isomerase, partial [Proteobacteria bacterium]|nr:peptidylprolyl isomerase [Pseudomonadota bacterium]
MVLFLATTAIAQDAANSGQIDSDVYNLFLSTRTQKPAAQATPQERTAVMNELAGIFVVSDLPEAKALGDEPQVKAQLELQRRIILFNAFAADFLASNQATEQEIFDLYEEQIGLTLPREFKARHILVESQGEALTLVKELQDGADFVELAKSRSTGPSAPNGGDLGWFEAKHMVKPFSDAVAAMEDGAFTTVPVQTQFGWHIILREASRDGTPPTLESVRDVVKQRVEQDKFKKFVAT